MIKVLTNIFAVLGLIATLGVAIGVTYHHFYGPEHRAEWIVKRISSKLDLDTTQSAKLQAVIDTVNSLRQDKFKSHEQVLDQIRNSIKSDTLDKQLLLGMVNEHADTVKQLAPAVIDKLAEFHASLTPAQREKLADHLDRFRHGGKFCGRHGHKE